MDGLGCTMPRFQISRKVRRKKGLEMGYDKRNLRHEKERARKLETRKALVAFARICMLLHAFT